MTKILLRRLRKAGKEEQGSSLIEFAISASVVLALILGIMDVCLALSAWHFVSWAAQSGTRYAIIRGAKFAGTSCSTTATEACDATAANVQSYVQSLAPPGVTASSVVVTTTWPGTTPGGKTCSTANGDGCFVQVNVSYTFNFILPFLPSSGPTLTSTSEQVIQE